MHFALAGDPRKVVVFKTYIFSLKSLHGVDDVVYLPSGTGGLAAASGGRLVNE
jgi:hypothetical protein